MMADPDQRSARPRDLRPRPVRRSLPALLLLAIALGVAWMVRPAHEQQPEALDAATHEVLRVVDGDTLLLTNKARVRLLGVDTPETVKPDAPGEAWGPEASAFSKAAVEGKPVRLEFDKERKDRYDRFLAYVFYQDPSTGGEKMLNEELIRHGLGDAALQYNYSEAMKRRFRKARDEAQRAGRGIWSADRRQAG